MRAFFIVKYKLNAIIKFPVFAINLLFFLYMKF